MSDRYYWSTTTTTTTISPYQAQNGPEKPQLYFLIFGFVSLAG